MHSCIPGFLYLWILKPQQRLNMSITVDFCFPGLLGHSSPQPPYHQLLHHQITSSISSAHIPFILKDKLKFSLQRHRKFTRTPSHLCLRLHKMCTLRQRDSESPNSALNPLSQTARNVHSETVRLRITKFCSQVSVADCTECAL